MAKKVSSQKKSVQKKPTAKSVAKKSNTKKVASTKKKAPSVKKSLAKKSQKKTPVKKTTKKVIPTKKPTSKKVVEKKQPKPKKVAKKSIPKVEEKPKYKPKAFTIKTGPPKAKVVEKPRKVTTRDQNEEELLRKGKERGFITYDEIIRYFPTIETDILYLEELYEKISAAGIDILEGGNLLDMD